MDKTLDFWFDFASNYSYLSMLRVDAMAQAAGVRVRLQPFLLGPIFKSLGWDNSPFVLQEAKGRYVWRDMERLCAKYGIAWRKPTVFPRGSVLAAKVAVAGHEAAWLPAFCRRVMLANFAEDRDIANRAVIESILADLGLDSAAILDAAASAPLREQTARAQALGIFGAPAFFVGDEMFWGNDRLEDALSLASAGAASP